MPMKVYEILFSFLEPTQAVGSFVASSPEEAVNILKQQVEGRVKDLVIDSVKEVADAPDVEEPSDLSPDRTLN